MAVAHLEVTNRRSFPFDYERIDGKLHFAVDPANPANARIVDLDKAPRDARGQGPLLGRLRLAPARRRRQQQSTPAVLRRQSRPARSGVPFNPRRAAATLPPTDEIDAGDGFLMQRGWSVAMCGWQWDVERQPGLIGLEAPQALGPDGRPIQGRSGSPSSPTKPHTYHRLAHWPLHPRPGSTAVLAPRRIQQQTSTRPTPQLTVSDSRGGARHGRSARALALRARRKRSGRSPTTRTSGSTAASKPAAGTRSSTPRASARWSARACSPRAIRVAWLRNAHPIRPTDRLHLRPRPLAVRTVSARVPVRGPEPGRGRPPGLRRAQSARGGRAARRVQPASWTAVRDESAQGFGGRFPVHLRRRRPSQSLGRPTGCCVASVSLAACRRSSPPTRRRSTGARIARSSTPTRAARATSSRRPKSAST